MGFALAGGVPFAVALRSIWREGALQGRQVRPQLRERSESERGNLTGVAEPLQRAPPDQPSSAGERLSAGLGQSPASGARRPEVENVKD
jgi:hypothetical protein